MPTSIKNQFEQKTYQRDEPNCTGLVVMAGDSCSEGWGSNPSPVYWMDIFSHLFVVKLFV